MKQKGFTLAELIGVVAILGVISVLVAPMIINQIRNSQNKIDTVTEELLFSATSLYLETREDEYPKINDNVYCIKLQTLVDDGKLQSPILDKNGSEISLNKEIKVSIENKRYNYSFPNSCTTSN